MKKKTTLARTCGCKVDGFVPSRRSKIRRQILHALNVLTCLGEDASVTGHVPRTVEVKTHERLSSPDL